MNNKIEQMLSTLNLYTISKMSIKNDSKIVAIEMIDDSANTHKVEFSNVDSYLFLDEEMLDHLNESYPLAGSITYFRDNNSTIVAVSHYEDGSVEEHAIASPNIILNTETASIMMEAKKVTINGESYALNRMLN